MRPESITSPIARIALTLLSVMWTATGWYLFLTKTFSTSPIRSKSITTVTGYPAQFLGLVFLVLGTIAIIIVLKSLKLGRTLQFLVLMAFLLVPPLAMQVALEKL